MTDNSAQWNPIVDLSDTEGAPIVWNVGPGVQVDPLTVPDYWNFVSELGELVLGNPGAGKGSGGAA